MHKSTDLNTFSENIDTSVASLVEEMTLAEKVGQMTQVEKNSITPFEVAEYFIGSVLSGGGGNPTPNNPQMWADMVRAFQESALTTRLKIPLLYGTDAVHGHSNVKGAVIFPHNIALGATRDAALVEKIAYATGTELLAVGAHWTFAPALSVPQDIRWGRTYEGFSEDPMVVAQLGRAYVKGLQKKRDDDRWILGTAKHFVADGGTTWGTTRYMSWLSEVNWQAATPNWKIDQGNAVFDEETLRSVHLAPYRSAIDEGILSIMASFSSWNGDKLHGHKYLLTDVLKGECGFTGFLVSDWMAIDQLDPDFYTCVVTAINAGLDMIMVPYDFKRFVATLTEAVEKGDVSQSRIDDAVARILRVKLELGLFGQPFGNDALLDEVGSDEHRSLAREAVSKSAVLLKNEHQVLPLTKDISELVVIGPAADDIGLQCGGWTIEWQGGSGAITDGTSLLAGIQALVANAARVVYKRDGDFAKDERFTVGIAVIAETPYAEGAGDRADLVLSEEDITLLENARNHCDKLIVILISGRPIIVNMQLPLMDAFIAAWLPGTQGQGIADVLFGEKPFSGKLPFSWPRSLAQIPRKALDTDSEEPQWVLGYGLTT
ncbi:MAG: glycoside hydrolase family 3 protein [Chloroflexi bacterium]|nr:glycoside hydrolase family 3 protein [Chloroflexota bacterium]